MVRIEITYKGGLRCEAVHGPSGKKLLTDAPVDNQGKGESFSPTDLVATALGTCMATIMGITAQREGIDLTGMKISVEKEMVADPRRRIGSLKTVIQIPVPCTDEQKKKLENAAQFCPVHETVRPETEMPIEFQYAEALC